jgi:hypothetical protein
MNVVKHEKKRNKALPHHFPTLPYCSSYKGKLCGKQDKEKSLA